MMFSSPKEMRTFQEVGTSLVRFLEKRERKVRKPERRTERDEEAGDDEGNIPKYPGKYLPEAFAEKYLQQRAEEAERAPYCFVRRCFSSMLAGASAA